MRLLVGDSQARVIELCGQPVLITTEFKTNLMWDDTRLSWINRTPIHKFHYHHAFSINRDSWQIEFDERSNVISKFHYILQ